MPTAPASHQDPLDSQLATLATVGPDGRPQLSTEWFLADKKTVRVSLNTTRQKTKNLTANRRVTIHVQGPANPVRYLEIRGDATIEADPDDVFADRVGAQYGSVDLRQMDQPGESRVVVTIAPVRINAVDLAAG